MPILECRKCLPIHVPDDWTEDRKLEVAGLVRKFGPLQAIGRFRAPGLDLKQAKGIVLHVSPEKGICRCQAELSEYEGKCPKCGRLNLDW